MPLSIEPKAEPIPGYRLLERLGRGGFGEVWKAQAPGGLLKAIKVVHGDVRTLDDDGSHRAGQELRALQRVQAIRHPYLLSLERYDIVEGRLVIVTELADCNLFDRYLQFKHQRLRGIPRALLLRYLREAAEVLDLMNGQHQLQHLDVKPQNLFLIHDHVKVADFGLVKDLQGVRTEAHGAVTPLYAAPETFEGVITPYCDQYSLAVVYQELLSGHRPFGGTTLQQLALQHAQAPPNLSTLPHADRAAVAKALAKTPEHRHPTCLAFIEAVEAAGHAAAVSRGGARVSDSGLEPIPEGLNVAESIRRLEHRDAKPFRPDTPPTIIGVRREPVVPALLAAPAARTAPPEENGPGVLFPAVVIGIGRGGRLTLANLRHQMTERFGGPAALPNLRCLYVETDQDEAAGAPHDASGIDASEVFLARLSRASHYLRPRRNGRSLIEGWFEPQWLYRIPRNPCVGHQRALGRLAFGDHYVSFCERLRAELETVLSADALSRADRATGLGVRSNRPRVYVAAALGGGTGSGMFLDVAYAARNQLRAMGYDQPEVIGLLSVPPVEARLPGAAQATANTFAALSEWAYYERPDTTYDCAFDDRDVRLVDPEAPFVRAAVLPWDDSGGPKPTHDGPGLAAELISRELTSPLGRAVDGHREAVLREAPATLELGATTFGMTSVSWPRRLLLSRAARRLCSIVIEKWLEKSRPAAPGAEQGNADEIWGEEFDVSQVNQRLRGAAEEAAGGQPLEGLFEQLARRIEPKGWFGGGTCPDLLRAVTDRWEELLGRPADAAGGVVGAALKSASQALAADWKSRIAHLTTELIERPACRLGGAEAAVSQLCIAAGRLADASAEQGERHAAEALRAFSRFDKLRAAGAGRRQTAELAHLTRLLPHEWYSAALHRQVARTATAIRDDLKDQLGEIAFCRQRIEELLRQFNGPQERPTAGRYVLPTGCLTADEAVEQLIRAVGEEGLRELDGRTQRMVQSQFTALVHVCLSTSNALGNLEPAMLKLAESILAPNLPDADVAALLLERDAAVECGGECFEAAAPALVDSIAVTVPEVTLLAVPEGSAGRQFAQAMRAVAETEPTVVTGGEDVVFYREIPRIPLARLPQLGPLARQAFLRVTERDGGPPYTRCDVGEFLPNAPQTRSA